MKKIKDAYYFSHDSNARNDEKILEMRADYGFEGYGLYWSIIEMMRDSSDTKLSYNSINSLSVAINFEKNTLKKFVDDCIEKYNLFILHEDKYYSNRLLRSIKRYKQISCKRSAIAKQMHSNKSKVKQSKVNKSKVKQSKKNTDIGFENFWNIYNKKTGNKDIIFKKWLQLKKEEHDKIFATLPDYIKSTPDKKYRKNPQTYLNQKSWLDEIIPISTNGIYKPKDLEPEKF